MRAIVSCCAEKVVRQSGDIHRACRAVVVPAATHAPVSLRQQGLPQARDHSVVGDQNGAVSRHVVQKRDDCGPLRD